MRSGRAIFTGASGLFGFVLKGGDEAARAALIDGLSHFGIGYSWAGSKAWRCLSIRSVIAPRPADPEGPLVRLHIGLEDPADLIADLEAGLARFRAVAG